MENRFLPIILISLLIACQDTVVTNQNARSNSGESTVIYGEVDNRHDANESKLEVVQKFSASVLIGIPRFLIKENEDSYIINVNTMKSDPFKNYCPGTRFQEEYKVERGACTGIAIGENKVLTAKHCIFNCHDSVWFLDFNKDAFKINENLMVIPKSKGLNCKNIIGNSDSSVDYSVFETLEELKRPIPEFSFDTNHLDTEIVIIGHPFGLSKKAAGGAKIQGQKWWEALYFANLDTLSGNSGSPIFDNKTSKLIGILVGGQADYIHNSDELCLEENRLENILVKNENSDLLGEKILPLSKMDKEHFQQKNRCQKKLLDHFN